MHGDGRMLIRTKRRRILICSKGKFGLTSDPPVDSEQQDFEDYGSCEAKWYIDENTKEAKYCKRDCKETGPAKLVKVTRYVCKASGAEGKLTPVADETCDAASKPNDKEVTDEPCPAELLGSDPPAYQAKCTHKWAEDDWAAWSTCQKECKQATSTRTRNVVCEAESPDKSLKFATKESRCKREDGKPLPRPTATETRDCDEAIDTKAPRVWKVTGYRRMVTPATSNCVANRSRRVRLRGVSCSTQTCAVLEIRVLPAATSSATLAGHFRAQVERLGYGQGRVRLDSTLPHPDRQLHARVPAGREG
jgi:hypothetical protein